MITIGSSKGGTCALYFGLRGKYGHVICMGPQTKIAAFLDHKGDITSSDQRMLDFMVGSEDKVTAYRMLDTVLFSLLEQRSNTHIHLLSSEYDPQYPIHIAPLLDKLDLNDPKNDITINNEIKSHSGLAEVNPFFVRSKLFQILYGANACWTEQGIEVKIVKRLRNRGICFWFAESPEEKHFCKKDELFPITKRGVFTPVLAAEKEGETIYSYSLPARQVGETGRIMDFKEWVKTQASVIGNTISVELDQEKAPDVSFAFYLLRGNYSESPHQQAFA